MRALRGKRPRIIPSAWNRPRRLSPGGRVIRPRGRLVTRGVRESSRGSARDKSEEVPVRREVQDGQETVLNLQPLSAPMGLAARSLTPALTLTK